MVEIEVKLRHTADLKISTNYSLEKTNYSYKLQTWKFLQTTQLYVAATE